MFEVESRYNDININTSANQMSLLIVDLCFEMQHRRQYAVPREIHRKNWQKQLSAVLRVQLKASLNFECNIS